MNTNENQEQVANAAVQTVTKNKGKRGRPASISFSGIRWDRMTNMEIAVKLMADPKNAGKIKASSLKNLAIGVYQKRKALAAQGRNVAFQGRTFTDKDGNKVVKNKWVRSKVVASK